MKKGWLCILLLALLLPLGGCQKTGPTPPIDDGTVSLETDAPASPGGTTAPSDSSDISSDDTDASLLLGEPPVLTLRQISHSETATRGGYSWFYAEEDGTRRAEIADSMHPLSMPLDLLVQLHPSISVFSSIHPNSVSFDFPVAPDQIALRGWPIEQMGNPDAPAEDFDVLENRVVLKGEAYLYELIATWNESDGSYGTVSYLFCFDPAFPSHNTETLPTD